MKKTLTSCQVFRNQMDMMLTYFMFDYMFQNSMKSVELRWYNMKFNKISRKANIGQTMSQFDGRVWPK